MTTKKSKPASLTSSLLARKGEAEPATAPYSIPESGRQQTADGAPAKGNGNGNGGDLGHALSSMTRRRGSAVPDDADDSLDVAAAENGVHADAVQSGSSSGGGSLIPSSDDALEGAVSEMEDEVELDLDVDVAVSPEDEADTDATDTDTDTAEPEDEPSAEVTLLEGAVAEEASIDEAVIEASVEADNAAERIAAETAAAIEKAGTPESEEDLSGPEEEKTASDRASGAGEAGTIAAMAPIAAAVAAEKLNETKDSDESAADGDREAARDARLLRFVYAMAALTGIVAIVLYAGGWLRDVPKPGQTETSVASSTPAASGDSQVADGTASTDGAPSTLETAGTAETPAMPATGTAGDSTPSASGGSADSAPVIPAAPPVTPPGTMSGGMPGTTDEKPVAPDSGLTTGGPAKPAVETAAPSAPSLSPDTLTIETPSAGLESADTSQPATAAPVETPAVADVTPQDTQKIDTSGAGNVEGGLAAASSSAADSSSTESDPVVVPTPITPESVAPPPVSTEPVRDVPNLRVLAPALVRPEPAETAPPTGTAPAAAAPAAAPTEQQTAALPKATPSDGRYRVQLASVSSEAVAKREWARLQKVFPDVFGDRTLVVEKKDIAGRGTFYRIQTGGYETLADARDVCSILKAKKQGCLPLKR